MSNENAVSAHIERLNAVETERRRHQTRQRIARRYLFRKAPVVAVLLIIMNRADMVPSAVLLMALVAIAIYVVALVHLVALRRNDEAVVSGFCTPTETR